MGYTSHMHTKHRAFAIALLLGVLAFPITTAHARSIFRRPHYGERPYQLDVYLGFAYIGAGPAFGGRFGFPIVRNGFIPSVNNAVYINVGADFYVIGYKGGKDRHYAFGFAIPVTMHWEFYFTPRWSAFFEVGPNIFFHPSIFDGKGWKADASHWFSAAVGGRFWFNRKMALTARAGNPHTSIGMAFMF
jgi:hypothetical protein